MAQTYTTDPYAGTGKTADAVMDDVNENFAALKSGFSGTSSPSNVVGGQIWHDDPTRKVRNYDNDAWLASLMGDASQKMWVYRNDTCDGWTIDTNVPDRILAFSNTSANGGDGSNAYAVDGGNTAGTWAPGTHTHGGGSYTAAEHNHKWYDFESSGHAETWDSGGSVVDIDSASASSGEKHIRLSTDADTGIDDAWTNNQTPAVSGTSGATAAHASTLRWSAAVGTLQYPDMT